MRFIALDLSTVSTGYAIFEDCRLLVYGTISANKKFDGIDRIIEIIDALQGIILKWKPTLSVIEEETVVSHKGQDTTGYLHGNVRVLLRRLGVSVYNDSASVSFVPSHWRKVLGFDQKGQTKGAKSKKMKRQSVALVELNYDLTLDTDDEADAICVGLAYLKEMGLFIPVNYPNEA